MDIFYERGIEEELMLGKEESQHCIKVLRHGVGDEIEVIDGMGKLFRCQITSAHPKRTEVKILECKDEFGSHPYCLTMAIAPTKNIDRFEWFVEKAVEIGVDRIVPLLCAHSERKVVKRERLEKIVISASKQSKKAKLAKVDEMAEFENFIEGIDKNSNILIAHCDEEYAEGKVYLPCILSNDKEIVILIGPEGDFSPEEIKRVLAIGGKGISLGESRLRTETAGVMAVAMVNIASTLSSPIQV